MALASVSLAGTTVTLLPGDPGTGSGSSNGVNISALNNGTLNVEGSTVEIKSIAGVTAASSATFNVYDGGNLTFNGGLVNLAAISSTTINIADGTVNMNAGGLGLAGLNNLLSETTINFQGGVGAFNFDGPTLSVLGSYSFNVTGMGLGDSVGVDGATFSSFSAGSATSGTLVLTVPGAISPLLDTTVTINMSAVDPSLIAALSANPNSVFVDGTLTVVCLLRGTHVLTPEGEVRVESLTPGDLVMTQVGEDLVPAPVKWIGTRAIDLSRHAQPEGLRPIRISAGALGENVPHRDLLVSRDHCMFIDGKLVEAHWLVNGSTITVDTSINQVEYFHVELDRHSLLIAEGAPTESYLETGNRHLFSNAKVTTLRPVFGLRSASEPSCFPLMTERKELLDLAARLVARAESLGWHRTRDARVHLRVDGQVLLPKAKEGRVLRFTLPAGVRSVELHSTHGVPRAVKSNNLDGRRLGIALAGLHYKQWGKSVVVRPGDTKLGRGFHQPETKDGKGFAWTSGNADITAMVASILITGGELAVEIAEVQTAWLPPSTAPATRKAAKAS
ncbi:Hint domain-containing protein [Acetobacteraceae bacterium H6797]|nr:Hint domain-containing protein [Acetobacteraceae bacterium H6797]